MKTYTIEFNGTVKGVIKVEAKDEKEATKKFCAANLGKHVTELDILNIAIEEG